MKNVFQMGCGSFRETSLHCVQSITINCVFMEQAFKRDYNIIRYKKRKKYDRAKYVYITEVDT